MVCGGERLREKCDLCYPDDWMFDTRQLFRALRIGYRQGAEHSWEIRAQGCVRVTATPWLISARYLDHM